MSLFGSIFGDSNQRFLKRIQPLVDDINSLELEFEKFSPEELKEATKKFQERLAKGETLDDLLPEAFAAVREAGKRTLGLRHFDVQLVGGIALHRGNIAEMRTGEGKTLVATLPLYLNALAGRGAHLVTPNDYLSRVGAGWMGPLYHALGISVGVIGHDLSAIYDPEFQDVQKHGDERLAHFRPVTRAESYGADITYGTNNEYGFDYLRDNLEYSKSEMRQREHFFAIVDEVDSILIDEARTPLIISAPDEESAELYKVFANLIPKLKESEDYNVDEKLKAVAITEDGINKVEKILGIENIYEERGVRFVRHLEQALRSQALFHRDRDYVVKNGEVIIVDEFTGRLMPGRRWSEGLHQAVEAKEGVQVQRESRTLATITFQNYFRMYGKLSGMTGTAQTSAEEFHKVYRLDVVTVPTNKPMVRKDHPDLVFRTEKGKFEAIVREVKKRNEKGQPVLIGTVSIAKNEKLSRMLEISGIPFQVLNAKNHEQEALIIAQAGGAGAVTVATNMAGRGVDIILGGNPPDDEGAQRVRDLGGLHVIGTERHEARRIDNQLRGRAGRQGDPGSSQFFVSVEDDLMRIFGSDRIKKLMETLGIPEDQPIEHNMVSKALESAQEKIEGFHFDSRKHVLEYDDVLNKQRDTIYRMRKEILFAGEVRDQILEMCGEEVRRLVEFHTQENSATDWNTEEIFESVKAISGMPDEAHVRLREIKEREQEENDPREEMVEYLTRALMQLYHERVNSFGEDEMRNIEQMTILRAIDMLWMDHLDQMEHLRDSVRLRAYGQRDPLVEYKHEGSRLFRELQAAIRMQVVNMIFKVGGIQQQTQNKQVEFRKPQADQIVNRESLHGSKFAMEQTETKEKNSDTNFVKKPEVNRNDPCPCGSGKKYKKCHGK